jgi:hypothetical protein
MIMLTHVDFRERDLYIDFPYERAKFRWEKDTEKAYRRFYGEEEVEIPQTSKLFEEAIQAGKLIGREDYFRD